MDTTLLTVLIVLGISVISPPVTAFIKSWYDLKLKKIDVVYTEKLAAYKEFLTAYNVVSTANATVDEARKLISTINHARLYCGNDFDKPAKDLLAETYDMAAGKSYSSTGADAAFNACTQILRQSIGEKIKLK